MTRVTRLNQASSMEGAPLTFEAFADSNFGGTPGMDRRSTDCSILNVAGTVFTATSQTQPGLPASSAAEAEIRGSSRCARDIVFVRDLMQIDFELPLEKPKLWLDNTAAIQTAKKLGQSTKLRHMDIGEMYVQELVRAGELTVGKIDGQNNPANVLTKHIGSKELQDQLINLGMVNLDQHADLLAELDAAQALQVASVLAADATSSSRISHANKSMHPWKPRHAATISALQLVTAASLLQGFKG